MNNSKQHIIAAFDFDGTITTKDTLFDFLLFSFGKIKVFAGLILLSPILILFKLILFKNDKAKEILISYFFKGIRIEDFNRKCILYRTRIESISNSIIIDKLKWHLEQNHEVIIISASIRNWIEPWALNHGIKRVLATEMSISNGRITGKFKNKNCYGREKVTRLLKDYPLRNHYILYAYGDSRGDKELLEIADYPSLLK